VAFLSFSYTALKIWYFSWLGMLTSPETFEESFKGILKSMFWILINIPIAFHELYLIYVYILEKRKLPDEISKFATFERYSRVPDVF
jgi:hypothetical protein